MVKIYGKKAVIISTRLYLLSAFPFPSISPPPPHHPLYLYPFPLHSTYFVIFTFNSLFISYNSNLEYLFWIFFSQTRYYILLGRRRRSDEYHKWITSLIDRKDVQTQGGIVELFQQNHSRVVSGRFELNVVSVFA